MSDRLPQVEALADDIKDAIHLHEVGDAIAALGIVLSELLLMLPSSVSQGFCATLGEALSLRPTEH